MKTQVWYTTIVGVLAAVSCTVAASAGAHTLAPPEVPLAPTGFTPKQATVGQTVTITGSNLDATTSVSFGKVEAKSIIVDPKGTWVKAVVPAVVASGAVQITLDAAGNNAQSIGPLTIQAGGALPEPRLKTTPATPVKVMVAPRILSVSPNPARIGTKVRISGANLTGTRWIKFGGVSAAHVTVLSATSLTATVPKGAHSGKLTVHTPGGTSVSSLRFTVVT
jgi:hypothetical protein